ncbi:MAG: hypothetical protein J4203_07870 [Candidatus Diapherotrites archaeon]|uniref:Uncharacterized protein n=1 Tax=Candidatus Iainarchaeum sp. TaxID=3101447 RepID=A0A8T4L9Y2_9ARCH|nr:hypothetical protein [Candidatus Diapherotrites archaeon]
MRRLLAWLDLAEKLLLVLLALGVVVWFLFRLEVWADYFRRYFLLTGDVTSLLYLFVGLLVLKKIFEWLLKWHVRATFAR